MFHLLLGTEGRKQLRNSSLDAERLRLSPRLHTEGILGELSRRLWRIPPRGPEAEVNKHGTTDLEAAQSLAWIWDEA